MLGCISVKGNDAEGNPVRFRQVILTKPEDGDMLWDLRRLRLGPTMEVKDPRHRKTFTRRMLSRVGVCQAQWWIIPLICCLCRPLAAAFKRRTITADSRITQTGSK